MRPKLGFTLGGSHGLELAAAMNTRAPTGHVEYRPTDSSTAQFVDARARPLLTLSPELRLAVRAALAGPMLIDTGEPLTNL